MKKRKPLTDAEGEVRELTAEDLADFIPFSAVPEAHQRMLLSLRGAKKTISVPPKTSSD